MALASTALTMARGLLNDPDPGSIYTDARLIPIMDIASRELQLMMFGIGALELKEIAALLTVPASTATLNAVAGYPNDVLEPKELAERDSGSTNPFTELVRQEWEPDLIADSWIKYWVFREGEVKLNPATSIRQVRFKYIKSLPIISTAGSTIPIIQSEVWLAYKTAETAARVIGENPKRADSLIPERLTAQNALMGNSVKGGQNTPVRHRRRTRRY